MNWPTSEPKRAAGLNDGAFGAERAAGANSDCRRKRFQDRDFGFDAAARSKHRLHRFRDAVTFDFFRAIFGHEADDHAADYGRDDDPRPQVSIFGAAKMKRPFVVIREIGEETDQIVQDVSNEASKNAE